MTNAVGAQLPAHLPRLWRFALRLTKNPSDAEDLVQRTCLRALEKHEQFAEGSVLLSWLFSIMHSVWLNEIRSAPRRHEARWDSQDTAAIEIAIEPSLDPEQRLMFAQVIYAVNNLPEPQRVVMLLVAVEGLSYAETAAALEIPIGTVMSRLARARLAMGAKFLNESQYLNNAASNNRAN